MDAFIRQLTHENRQFDSQWPDTFTQLQRLSNNVSEEDQPTFKVKVLDALADYILADTEEPSIVKGTFITVTLDNFTKAFPASLPELARIFSRVLKMSRVDQVLHVALLESIFNRCELGTQLSSPPSIDLLETIFSAVQQHSFLDSDFADKKVRERWEQFMARRLLSPLDSDKNKVNYPETMEQMRSSFQQLYR